MLAWLVCAAGAWGLDPRKGLTQYSRTVWTQQHGLPQDTIRAIAQTADGYLWLGTDEGLARFDGYDFVTFDKSNGDLPANSVTALAAARDGSLWIGTSNGLVQYRGKQFRIFTTKQGLPDNAITSLSEDDEGSLWIVAGNYLSHFQRGKFTNLAPGKDLPIQSVRTVEEDHHHQVWVGGFNGVVKRVGDRFVPVVDEKLLAGGYVTNLLFDRQDNLWAGGSAGILVRSPAGAIRRYDTSSGLPNMVVRVLLQDRDGNIWAGTNGGLARLDSDRFVPAEAEGQSDEESVRCLFEDREGDLWVGATSGLTRMRDDVFTVYGKNEGLPSDVPNTVFQDRKGHIWVGFHDSGLMMLESDGYQLYTTRNGLPNNEVFAVREARNGDLLISVRGALVRMHGTDFTWLVPPDPLSRINVFDAVEDSKGRIWLATAGGLNELTGGHFRVVVPGGPVLVSAMMTVYEDHGGSIWAGTYGKGLWRVNGDEKRLFTMADGLSSDQIRTIYQDKSGTLWIGTFGGGLDAYRGGKFYRFTEADGLLSDNIANISDDGQSLWLSTTRGICRIPKKQLDEFATGNRRKLEPTNYGVENGLRSAQCAPAYPNGGGGTRTADGRLWFTTTRGLAVYDPRVRQQQNVQAPVVHLVEMTSDRKVVDLTSKAELSPGSQRIQIRYTAIHLSAPERVQYSYRLEGLDNAWVSAGSRRLINFNTLHHGSYRFTVKADLPGGPSAERSYAFVVLPQFYETTWFRVLCGLLVAAATWAVIQLRLRQIRLRFALVLDERARLAREIHDTLAQGFVGISSQLDAVAMSMPKEDTPARKYLETARRMARHSLTEARRSVMDLRSSVLEGQNLAAALQSGARMWSAGSGVDVAVDVSGAHPPLSQEMEQHLLRIAQEAVTNTLKHAGASKIWIKLHMEARKLYMQIVDNGRGFEQGDAFSSHDGHFGLIGMRERAERIGGELRLSSHPGEGTQVEVMAPLP